MPAIQLRRGSAIPTGEMHHIGEPMWDPESSRLGIYNARTPTAMEWYPCVIGNKLLLNPSQTLGGKISSGAENNVYFDWSVQDQLVLRNRSTSAVYATFAAAGASLNALASVGTPYLGLTNLLLNGNIAVKRGTIPITTVNTGVVNQRSSLVAPNWQLWRTDTTAGVLMLSHGNPVSGVPYVGAPGLFNVSVSGAPNSAGLRTFLFGYDSVAGREITFSVYLQGVNGAKTYIRAMTNNGLVLFSEEFTADGTWQRFTKTVTPSVNDSAEWIGFDVLYNPSWNTSQSQTWKVASAQIQYGNSASLFENRPLALEQALCTSIYQEGKVRVAATSEVKSVPLNNFANGLKVEVAHTEGKAVTISNMDAYGFDVQVPTLVAASHVKYVAYQMPIVAETA